jgi:signal transduction histidine kinase
LADPRSSPLLLSVLPPSTSHRRGALAASLVLLAGFLAALPFAQIAWVPIPAFVLIQQTLLLSNDLITAAVLFGQYFIGRTRILNVLAGGYLFTALIVIPHALTFPGAFSDTGLLGGPQSAAWLYIGWHAVLPLTVIVFALRRVDESPGQEIPGAGAIAILIAVVAAVGIVAAMTLLATSGSASLPALIESGSYTTEARVGVGILLVLPLGALLTLTRRQPRSVLDLWLMVVMFGWLCNTGLGAFASSGRYDVGWYVGRVFDWLTSLFILLIFLSETIGLYARNTRATAVVLHERERRLNEMEAVLVHLSRVNELGQNVSSLIHEVSQPLAAITNYLAASIELMKAGKTDRLQPLLERSVEQARRGAQIVRHLRDFIARHETPKRIENVSRMLQDGVRLALDGSAPGPLAVDIQCIGTASAFCDRVQIEQVVFNLVRNAVEAMADSGRRALAIAADSITDDMIEVSVADTGAGLSPKIRAKLFEPFVTTKASGLGVGLSICRVIIEAHGGQLWADDNPGGGTIFRFTLPQGPTPAEQ